MHSIPSDLKYTNTHVWLEDMGENIYRVGITDFAQDELGDVVFVEMPEIDREYGQSDECAVVESVKSTPVCANLLTNISNVLLSNKCLTSVNPCS